METKMEVIFEDDSGILHTMIVDSVDNDNRTLTGFVTVFKDGPDKHSVLMGRVKVTIHEYQLRQ